MTSRKSAVAPRFFATPAAFRTWLMKHAATHDELLVGYHKVDSGKPGMTWPESVDEALCVGWIDAVRKRIDEHAYQIRFTRRKPGSIWSAVNIAKVESLIAQGRMQPAGLEAFARRTARKSGVYAYEQAATPSITTDEERAFRKNKAAWSYFEACPPGYRKTLLYWIANAKQPATRARRLVHFIAACAAGKRLR